VDDRRGRHYVCCAVLSILEGQYVPADVCIKWYWQTERAAHRYASFANLLYGEDKYEAIKVDINISRDSWNLVNG